MYLTLSYLSSSSSKLNNDDIETLLINAKLFNNANHIRGILIYSDKTFFLDYRRGVQ